MANVLEVSTENDLKYQFFPVSSGSVQFKVRTANDAHVALTMGPQESDPMYEVIIGGWGNTKSVIRRNRTKPEMAEIDTPDIVNAGEFRGFWVRWDRGIISAGREGEPVPFLAWEDPEPFPISFVGVCTGWGASGSWKVEDGPEFDTPDKLDYIFNPVLSGSLELEYKGPHNCHVCLSTTPADTDPIYELILGGWENTQSVIRYCRQKPEKVTVPTPSLCDSNEFRRFLIQWKNGRVQVLDVGNNAVIMDWQDPAPFPVAYFGVRTGWGATGNWRIFRSSHGQRLPEVSAPPASEAFSPGLVQPAGGAGVWVDASGGQVPEGAVVGGQDCSGEPLYVARARHEGALLPGKLVASHGCAYVPWGGGEHGKNEYQVLVSGPNNWVPTTGADLPPGAFPGGETEDGEPLFVGRVRHEGSTTTGKVQQSHGVCYISFGSEELGFQEYEVLVA